MGFHCVSAQDFATILEPAIVFSKFQVIPAVFETFYVPIVFTSDEAVSFYVKQLIEWVKQQTLYFLLCLEGFLLVVVC